jgi:hypothetical protein
MRKVFLIVVMVATVAIAFGQKNVRQSASNYLKSGKLDLALESINQCIQDPSTAQDPKTWLIRGNVYMEIANSKDPKYQALDTEPTAKGLDSYKKALDFDTKKEYFEEIFGRLNTLRNGYYNAAVDAYNKKDYKGAMNNFGTGAEVIQIANISDTASLLNAAFCAAMANDNVAAKGYYIKLLNGGYKSANLYVVLSDIYRQEKDSVNALKVVRDGIQNYPNDLRLFLAETNIYLTFGNTPKALRNLTEAINKDSSNASVFFALGTIYDKLANDSTLTNEQRDMNFNKAIGAYQKATILKPDYFEPSYNLGALYVNRAATINDEANKLPLDQSAKYDELKKQADSYLEAATPFLERASQLQPNDLQTLYSLKQIYAREGKNDKLKVVNAQIEALTK